MTWRPLESTDSDPFVFRLLPEILQAVFISLAHDHHRKDYAGLTSTIPSWVNVSYVCRRWRNVALSCPNLWTYHFTTSLRWTEELLERSNQAPLRIIICVNGGRNQAEHQPMLRIVERLVDHVERIEELCISVPDMHGKALLSVLSSCAPRLKKLSIWAVTFPALSVDFQGGMPVLRKLRLHGPCTTTWYLLKLDGLTGLKLFNVPRANMETFLPILKGMRHLRRLYLIDALAGATEFLSSAAFNTFQKIDLPHLSRLRVGQSHSEGIALLSCINMPSETEFRIDYHHEPDSAEDLAHLCSFLERQFSSQTTPTIRSLLVQSRSLRPTKLVFSASEHYFEPVSSSDWGHNILLEIDFLESISDDRIISDILCALSLTDVQSVHFSCPSVTGSSAFWRKVLEQLPGLRHFKLDRCDIPDLVPLLSCTARSADMENHDGYDYPGPAHELVPALEELELYDVVFSPTSREDPGMGSSSTDDVQSLCDALASRKQSRGRVNMSQCAVGDYGPGGDFDMVGRWEAGRFHIDTLAKVYFKSRYERMSVVVEERPFNIKPE